MIKISQVIMCGGSGTRLWPLSRSGFPKQFLTLTEELSLFQQTLKRLNTFSNNFPDVQTIETFIITNEEHRFLALEQSQIVGRSNTNLILEPSGRNTAPALTIAALAAIEKGEDPILVVTPSDQVITDLSGFAITLNSSIEAAVNGALIIFGIKPTSPETGYGYINCDVNREIGSVYPVVGFKEKPTLELAKEYISSESYYWNSGIFVMRASVWLKALEEFRLDILTATKLAWYSRSFDEQFIRFDTDLFERIPSESIDYAVIEKLPNSQIEIKMASMDVGWNDLGSWDSVWQVSKKDAFGNTKHGDVISLESKNNLIYSSGRLVSVIGAENLIIVETPDAVLVAERSKSQDVKKIVQLLEVDARIEQSLHRKVHRPWGWYDSIDEDGRFKVKRINVKPGASLSLQKHHHRAEHWIVVKGTAEVTCGENTILLTENQSTYIPLGEIHRLKNPGVIPLEIIEVQSGTYLGEDDIIRYKDSYGRN
jgi:mannose-1-phosphate guanylyltransferase/mannose-6-phosphate isomerase